MRSKAIIPTLVGVGIGLLTLKMGWNYIEKSRLSAEASQGNTSVVVASRSVPPGTPLLLEDLKTAKWPRSAVPTRTFTKPEELVGRVNLVPLSTNLPVLEDMLTPPGTTPGLGALIPPGFQGMAVKVDEFAGVAGFLKPGDEVDVVATFNVKRSKAAPSETVTRTILRNIKVIAVGQAKELGENNQPMVVRSVTLLVKPLQAQELSLASTRGTIRLSLRSGQGTDSMAVLPAISFTRLLESDPEKRRNAKTKSATGWMQSLLKAKKPATPTVIAKVDPHWQMRIVRGASTEAIVFENASSSKRVKPSTEKQKNQGIDR